MSKLRTLPLSFLAALLALGLMASLVRPVRAGNDVEQKAVDRAHDFLNSAQRGQDILSYVHSGTEYKSHTYLETLDVTRDGKTVPGKFVLVYRFKWAEDGITDVGFFCGKAGDVYGVRVLKTNAVFNQPFVVANATIKVVGNLLIGAFKDKMTEADRKQVQKMVDDADAKAMLVWSLQFQQALGK
jgi:hypothetical protein